MEKNLKYAALLDVYGGLLTEKQAQALGYYYNNDYSLGEISELTGITRQGARDFIKRGEAVLSEAEEKLGLYGRLKGLESIIGCAEEILSLGGGESIDALARRIIGEAENIQNGEK